MSVARDNFSEPVKRVLAQRVGGKCSNPLCLCVTIGPNSEKATGIVNIGVAAHITAAAKGGPRYDASVLSEQRRSIENGIWLCQTCAKLIDNDVSAFTIGVLREWKVLSESRARDELLGITPEDLGSALNLIHTPRLGWMAGMGYNACFQAAADGEVGSKNFSGLIYQVQPLLERLGIAISLSQEMTKPDFLDQALPLEFRIQSDLVTMHGRLVSAAFTLGKNIGPTTGLLMRYIQDDKVRSNIINQGISLEGLVAAVDEPLHSLRSVVGEDVLKVWSEFNRQIADGLADATTVEEIDRWRYRIREIMTE
jgi:hypothetical protein